MLAVAAMAATMVLRRGDETSVPTRPTGPSTVALVNAAALDVIDGLDRVGPTIVARDLYLVHGAIYEAWAAFDDRATGQVHTIYDDAAAARFPEAPVTEIVMAAAHQALSEIASGADPSVLAPFEALADDLGLAPVAPGVGSVGALAALVASEWLESRRDDGSNAARGFRDLTDSREVVSPTQPPRPTDGGAESGVPGWEPEIIATGTVLDGEGTPTVDLDAPDSYRVTPFLTTHWGGVAPFSLESGDQYRITADAPAVDDLVAELSELVALAAELTDEQRAAAAYWSPGESDGYAPGRWCELVRQVAAGDRRTDIEDITLFFALSGALFDASIASTDIQVESNHGRPVTLVPALLGDESWRPNRPAGLGSPASPGYVADDSVYAAAAAEVLEQVTGRDAFGQAGDPGTVTVVASTTRQPAPPRADVVLTWPTFDAAAEQAGRAQQWSGAAVASADEDGRTIGRSIGSGSVLRASALMLGLIEPPR